MQQQKGNSNIKLNIR